VEIKCLFGLFPREYVSQIQQDTIRGMQNAANNLQWELLRGFDSFIDCEVSVLNSMYIGSFPKKYRKWRIPTFSFSHNQINSDLNVGFINLPIIKVFSRYFGIIKHMKEWLGNDVNNKAVVVYAMTFPFVQVLMWIKKHYPQTQCCLIVPDLPEYMNASAMEKTWYRICKKMQKIMILHCIKHVDCYVLLTEHMKDWFSKPIEYVVVEGIARESELPHMGQQRKKNIFYAGMVEEKYGVVDLVRSFIELDRSDWNLEIFGDGTSLKRVKELAAGHCNIYIRGLAPHAQVISAQKEAAVLVNPRKNDHVFTRYSFPSKILEYMSSGTPMLAYKLEGMPQEYDPYYFHIDDHDGGLLKALQMVVDMNDDDRIRMGIEAYGFVKNKKNAREQCDKIYRMLLKGVHYEEENTRREL